MSLLNTSFIGLVISLESLPINPAKAAYNPRPSTLLSPQQVRAAL